MGFMIFEYARSVHAGIQDIAYVCQIFGQLRCRRNSPYDFSHYMYAAKAGSYIRDPCGIPKEKDRENRLDKYKEPRQLIGCQTMRVGKNRPQQGVQDVARC